MFKNYYFIFDTEEQSIFSFVALNFMNVKAKFVN